MRRFMLLMIFIFLFVVVGCEEIKDDYRMSDQQISESLDALLHADSFETQFHFRMVTQEMILEIDPLLTYQYYSDEDGFTSRLSYHNKIMEGMGLNAFELIFDNQDNTFYLNDTSEWYKLSLDNYGEDIDLDNFNTEEIEDLNRIIINAITDFDEKEYIEVIEKEDQLLVHYVLEYNVYNILSDLFDYLNEGEQLGFSDFASFISSMELEDFITLLEKFKIDVYFDVETNNIARIELELTNIIKDIYEVMEDQINESIADENIDVKTILEYLEDLEIGVNFYNINSLDEILIPTDAKNSDEINLGDLSDLLDLYIDYNNNHITDAYILE